MDTNMSLELGARYLALSLVTAVVALLVLLAGLAAGLADAIGAVAGGRTGLVAAVQADPGGVALGVASVLIYLVGQAASLSMTVDAAFARETGRHLDEVESQLSSEIQRLRHDINEFQIEGFREHLDEHVDDHLDDRIDGVRRDLGRELQGLREDLAGVDRRVEQCQERVDGVEARTTGELRELRQDLHGVDGFEEEVAAYLADLEATVERLDNSYGHPFATQEHGVRDE